MSAEGTRVLARVRRVVRIAEYETFELTEEVEVYAEPGKSMEMLTTVREKVIRSVNEACDVVAAAHRPGPSVPVAPVSIPLQAAPPIHQATVTPSPPIKSGAYPTCANCGGDLQRKTGTSKKTGKAYDMVACPNRDCSYILPEVERKRYEAA